MSMNTSFVYGYGFYVNAIKDQDILTFAKKHADSLPDGNGLKIVEILGKMDKETFNLKDFTLTVGEELNKILLNNYYGNLRDALLEAIAEIMRNETSIWFEYQSGQEDCIGNEGAIMLAQAMPWQFRGPETLLTEEEFINLCKKYTTELGIPDEDIGELEIEYYG